MIEAAHLFKHFGSVAPFVRRGNCRQGRVEATMTVRSGVAGQEPIHPDLAGKVLQEAVERLGGAVLVEAGGS